MNQTPRTNTARKRECYTMFNVHVDGTQTQRKKNKIRKYDVRRKKK